MTRLVGWTVTAAVLGALALAGCTEVLGFERSPEILQCVLNSDCVAGQTCSPEGFCTVQCNADVDCQTPPFPSGYQCSNHQCRPSPDVGVPDAQPDGPGETGVDVVVDSLDAEQTNDGGCEPSCQLGLCVERQCVPGIDIGPINGDTLKNIPGRYLTGVQVQIPVCGSLVGIGFTLSSLGSPLPHVRLALYSDDNGPTTLLAQTQEWSVSGMKNDVPIEGLTPLVGCQGHATHWVFFASDATDLNPLIFQAVSTTTTTWLFSQEGAATIAGYLSSSLPTDSPWAGSLRVTDHAPAIYPIIVQSRD
jgi:hypothetical protein